MSRWVVLYTHQKTKIKKKWFDGQVQVLKCGKRCALFDDDKERIYTFFLRKKDALFEGSEINTEKYLLQIEKQIGSTIPVPTQNKQISKASLPRVSTQFKKPKFGVSRPNPIYNKSPRKVIYPTKREPLDECHSMVNSSEGSLYLPTSASISSPLSTQSGRQPPSPQCLNDRINRIKERLAKRSLEQTPDVKNEIPDSHIWPSDVKHDFDDLDDSQPESSSAEDFAGNYSPNKLTTAQSLQFSDSEIDSQETFQSNGSRDLFDSNSFELSKSELANSGIEPEKFSDDETQKSEIIGNILNNTSNPFDFPDI